ncbi:MAG TPA: hypothetical protein DIT28_18645 [Oxalobacteraceae bacterium]|jgi:hypothetical protein|nr:hypothetical protein [Oxalobacteraceae bacterium]HCN91163.1 hypothetical protein [Oxalobacteraceae bacterium]
MRTAQVTRYFLLDPAFVRYYISCLLAHDREPERISSPLRFGIMINPGRLFKSWYNLDVVLTFDFPRA